MDPNTTYNNIKQLMQRERSLTLTERRELFYLTEALQNWINAGGFQPDNFDPVLLEQASHVGC